MVDCSEPASGQPRSRPILLLRGTARPRGQPTLTEEPFDLIPPLSVEDPVMHCPHCRARLWNAFARALATPKSEPVGTRCRRCAGRATVALPAELTDPEYTIAVGIVVGFALAWLASLDAPPVERLQYVASLAVVFLGGVGVVTWTRARVSG